MEKDQNMILLVKKKIAETSCVFSRIHQENIKRVPETFLTDLALLEEMPIIQ